LLRGVGGGTLLVHRPVRPRGAAGPV